MKLSPAFQLLGKFTQGIPARQIYGAPTQEDILAVSEYLGVSVAEYDPSSAVEKLTSELTEQNRFLTANLYSDEIESSDLYRRSLFIREIVKNNREGRSDC
jgi:hypothetical protein